MIIGIFARFVKSWFRRELGIVLNVMFAFLEEIMYVISFLLIVN